VQLFFLSLPAATTAAQDLLQPQVVQGLSLSPFIFEDSVQKGQTLVHQIQLLNNSAETLYISHEIADFKAGNDTGQPLFLGPGEAANPNYSLSSWVEVKNVPAKLLPEQKQVVTAKISVPLKAEDGTHYGAILFSYNSAANNGAVGTDIIKKAGTLFFLKIGTANEQGNIINFSSSRHFFTGAAATFSTIFQNTGNVHLKPKGQVLIKNIFGQLVASIAINRDAQIVLPQTFRTFQSFWHPFFPLGLYTATSHVYYGDSNLESIDTISFWIFPIKSILIAIIIIIILGFSIIYGVKKYNSWIIKKSEMQNKRPVKNKK
jgi:hypothetical protein